MVGFKNGYLRLNEVRAREKISLPRIFKWGAFVWGLVWVKGQQ